MGKMIISGGGGSGAGSDECTASKAEVLKGYKAITSDSADEVVEGTLELTGDVSDSQVLEGKTYYNTNPKIKRTGSMVNHGAVSLSLNAGASYTVPAGFHNGGGKVTANSLASQTPATATAAQIINGQTAWVNGNKITGNMPNYSTTPTPIDAIRMNNNRFEVAVARGFHGYTWADNGYEYMSYDQVANTIGLTPEKLKKGEWVCGRTGTFEGWVPTANDLYVRGNNIAGFTHGYGGTVKYEAGGVQLLKGTDSRAILNELSAGNIDYTKYNYLNIEGYYEVRGNPLPSERNLNFRLTVEDAQNSRVVIARSNNAMPANYSNFTRSVYIGPVALSRRSYIRLEVTGEYWYDGNDGRYWDTFESGGWFGWVYRIWLS